MKSFNMPKKLLLIFLLFAMFLLASCKKAPENTEITPTELPVTTETTVPSTSVIPSLTENSYLDSVKYSRDGDHLTVNITDSKKQSSEFGVIILTDAKYADNWKENISALIDIAQLSTDDSGKGSVTLNVPESVSEFTICISHSVGNYIENVGGSYEN